MTDAQAEETQAYALGIQASVMRPWLSVMWSGSTACYNVLRYITYLVIIAE